MSDRIYVFVDESGSHVRQDCYVITGCWCATSYTDPTSILQPTRNRLSDNVFYEDSGPSPGREIKGSRSDEAKLNSAFAYLRKIVERDKTIRSNGVLAEANHPLGFTTFAIDSELGERFTRRYLGEGRTYTTIQVIGLMSMLTPLIRLGSQTPNTSLEARVILDAETWTRPSAIASEMIDAHELAPETTFETHDSTAVPGIQLSDIAAYSRRLRLLDGKCRVATEILSSLEL